jgi:hypothetical protein
MHWAGGLPSQRFTASPSLYFDHILVHAGYIIGVVVQWTIPDYSHPLPCLAGFETGILNCSPWIIVIFLRDGSSLRSPRLKGWIPDPS